MAETQTLLEYVMVVPPGLPTILTEKTPNKTNDQYNWRQINSVGTWPEFTYGQIMQRYGQVLEQAQIVSEPMPDSPPQVIHTKGGFANRFHTYIHSRLRRALRAGFQHLAPQLATLHLTPVTVDLGDATQIIDGFSSDIALFQARTLNSTPNRCPGILKASWDWTSDWETAEAQSDRIEYLQVLSETNFYMKQHNARYGFILTDTELVPVKRLDANGNLLVARAIPWEAAGPGRSTVLLSLWYLGMLSAADDEWQIV
ncbi:hypothetical protein AJ79_03265 [Helicocarpus griseus UAMH5409]|uniref:Uncharacterized protein n=1 Tax=Helicocarpus griseus UAMH5409 TaxID=1447875 RepID=A0A2B7XXQ8_9EURO|nr:hypothetical protein AJ79_03265 [Helicocarpus griseus UAMH5409]